MELPVGAGVADSIAVAAQHAVPGDIDDDMAILVLRSSPTDLDSRERVFPAEPIMVSEARRLAAATFAAWQMDPDQADLACLLVSEVVTNAVLHASVTPTRSRGALLQMVASATTTGASAARHPGSTAGHPEAPQVTRVARLTPRYPGLPAVEIVSLDAHQSPREFRVQLRRGGESVWVEVFDPACGCPGSAARARPTRGAGDSTS